MGADERRATPDLFRQHSVTELRSWSDHDLEASGRLTTPLRYNPDTDCFVTVEWTESYQSVPGHH